MLSIQGNGGVFCDGVRRRRFLQVGGLALGGLSLPQIMRAQASAGTSSSHKAVIMVLLPGGPPHLDMYDLKPDAPAEIRGEFTPISTAVPGIQICEHMPRLAKLMDKLVLIRSLVGARDDHNIHQCITGWESHPAMTKSPEIPGYPPGGWPSLGSVLSKVFGPAVMGVPPSVDLTPVDYDSRFVVSANPGQGGYLGTGHSGFEVAAVDRENIVLNGISLDRLGDRRSLLRGMDQFSRAADLKQNGGDAFMQQALAVLTAPRLAQALDLSREDPSVLKRYGLGPDGQELNGQKTLLDQFVIARRVVEAGARCVTLCFSHWPFGRMLQGEYNWDWHKDNFQLGRMTLPLLDIGLATLIEDLDERGMLDDVAVVAWGEFGRTPKINQNAGRDHWPKVGGALLAGGGLRTGQVVGSTNRYGEEPKDRPVHFREVFATLYHQMGINVATTQFTDFAGRPHYLVDGRVPMPELI